MLGLVHCSTAAIAVKKLTKLAGSIEDGYDNYRLENCTFLQSFITRLARLRQPKDVKFAEEGEVVVGGSDHGIVYVFGSHTGAQLELIHHQKDVMVQTIAVRNVKVARCVLTSSQTVDLASGSMIAAGTSAGNLGKPKISLWK